MPFNHIKNKKTNQTITIVICLLISTIMWFYINLSKNFNVQVNYTIDFVNKPKGLILVSDSVPVVNVGLTARGFDLINEQYLKTARKITLNFEQVKAFSSRDYKNYYVLLENYKPYFEQQIPFKSSVFSINPDTLIFNYLSKKSKQIPIELDIDYTINSQFDQIGEIEYSPKYVEVYSTNKILDSITSIKTAPIKFTDIDTNVIATVPLLKPVLPDLMQLSSDSVSIKIEVIKVTEATIRLKIFPRNDLENIEFYPEYVNVIYRVPLEMYNQVIESQFLVTADIENDSINMLKVEVEKQPEFVKIVRIDPPKVEFLKIIK